MTRRKTDDEPPRPEHLAAYVDGELAPEARRAVEAWLADHPDAAAEVADQSRLAGLWRQTAPAELPEAVWADALTRVEAALSAGEVSAAPSAHRGAEKRRRLAWALALLSGAAAAVLIALGTGRLWAPDPEESEPFVVAEPHDVDIISMDAAAFGALVVGDPPVQEPLVLASTDDFRLHSFIPSDDGLAPTVVAGEDGSAPMIVLPLKGP
jgi:anti-sigma factor RsiW